MTLGPQFQPIYETDYGMARVSPSGYISNLHVRPRDRGAGHGTELLRKITTDADAMGKSLTLHAREDLHPLYERFGFESEGIDPAFDMPKLVRQPAQ